MTNIEIKVRGIFNDLSNAERKVASYFLNDMQSVFNLPIATLAKESQVSQVAWVRFCKSLGFAGLKDFKKSLIEELNEKNADKKNETVEIFTDIKNIASMDQIVSTVRQSSIRAIEDTLKLLDFDTMECVANHIIEANSVELFGAGASALVAEDFYNKLLRIGKSTCFSRDNHIQLTYAANLTPNDVAIFISNSGTTNETNEYLDIAKNKGCITVAITKYGKNPLSSKADFTLYTSSPEVYRRSGAMSSRIAQLILIDTLFTTIASHNYEQVAPCLENSYLSCCRHRLKNDFEN